MSQSSKNEPPLSLEERLFALRAEGLKPGLAPTRGVLDALGAPDGAMSIVQVAGSIGKGSTSAMTASVLRAAGVRTALFTSPHLVRFGERFIVDGREASSEEIETAFQRAWAAAPWAYRSSAESALPERRPLSFFEWATVIGCLLFAQEGAEAAVLEVGLGGRWDATTACKADVTVISRLDLEHTQLLGESLEEIAAEKAGVMRPGVPAVTVRQDDGALAVLRERAAAVGAPLTVIGLDAFVREQPGGQVFDYESPTLEVVGVRPALLGRHQIENAALAIAATDALAAGLPGLRERLPDAVREGMAACTFAGRLEEVRPGLWLDGAHTAASMRALAYEIEQRMPGGKAHLVFAALADKKAGVLLDILRGVAASVSLTSAGGDRACDPGDLAQCVAGWGVPCRTEPDPAAAVQAALETAGDVPVVVCGSLYLVGAVKAALRGAVPDPGDPVHTAATTQEPTGHPARPKALKR